MIQSSKYFSFLHRCSRNFHSNNCKIFSPRKLNPRSTLYPPPPAMIPQPEPFDVKVYSSLERQLLPTEKENSTEISPISSESLSSIGDNDAQLIHFMRTSIVNVEQLLSIDFKVMKSAQLLCSVHHLSYLTHYKDITWSLAQLKEDFRFWQLMYRCVLSARHLSAHDLVTLLELLSRLGFTMSDKITHIVLRLLNLSVNDLQLFGLADTVYYLNSLPEGENFSELVQQEKRALYEQCFIHMVQQMDDIAYQNVGTIVKLLRLFHHDMHKRNQQRFIDTIITKLESDDFYVCKNKGCAEQINQLAFIFRNLILLGSCPQQLFSQLLLSSQRVLSIRPSSLSAQNRWKQYFQEFIIAFPYFDCEKARELLNADVHI